MSDVHDELDKLLAIVEREKGALRIAYDRTVHTDSGRERWTWRVEIDVPNGGAVYRESLLAALEDVRKQWEER